MDTEKQLKESVKDCGFALTEVLVTLVVTGIILAFSLRLFTDQWRVTREVKDRMEAHFTVLNAGRTVIDNIREAQTVEWDNKGVLHILSWNQGATQDSFYIADKDNDGIKDLYFEHMRVPNPVASQMMSWNCTKGEGGMWTVTLQAQVGRQTVNWTGTSRQRTYLPPKL